MNFINVQTSTCQYVQGHTGTYAYIPFLALFKKSANRSRTRNLVHTSYRVHPCAIGPQTSMPVKVRKYVSVYIIWLCETPCQCTWRLMTNRRPGGAGPAAPPPPAMTSPARAWTRISWPSGSRQTEDLIRKRQWLDSCPVFSTQHWAIPSQRQTHLNARLDTCVTPGRPLELEL
jgi:hypothetical protein